jgi:hypothetical protein
LRTAESLSQEATTSSAYRRLFYVITLIFDPEQALQTARAAHARAQKDTADALLRYTTCLETENQARAAMNVAEKRRDDISVFLLSDFL